MYLSATTLTPAMGSLLYLAFLYWGAEGGELASYSSLCGGLLAWDVISGEVAIVKMGIGTRVPQSVGVLGRMGGQ